MTDKPSEPSLRRRRILVIDDDPNFLIICKVALTTAGFDVSTVDRALKSLDAVREEGRPDLVVLDVMMPGMDGLEAMRFLDDYVISYKIPVVYVSANSDRRVITKALQRGGADYLVKPFGPEELIKVVKKNLERFGRGEGTAQESVRDPRSRTQKS